MVNGISRTKEECHQEALKYKTRTEFSKKSNTIYSYSIRKGWLDDNCSHMIIQKIKRTKDECHQEALKYKTRTEFKNESNKVYIYSTYKGWLDDNCSHMEYVYSNKPTKRTKEECLQEALKYKTRTDFRKTSYVIYNYIINKGWSDDLFSHMEYVYSNKPTFRTKEECHKEALKYKTRTEFELNSSGSYRCSLHNGWLEDHCSHMKCIRNRKRTKEECHNIALKYKTKKDFIKNANIIYDNCLRKGWVDDVCSHMIITKSIPNTIYFWKVLGEDIWKPGICHIDRLNIRINEVANSHNFQVQEYYYKQVDNCREMEKLFLSKGYKINSLLECDGYTEFRTYDDYELNEILNYFNS